MQLSVDRNDRAVSTSARGRGATSNLARRSGSGTRVVRSTRTNDVDARRIVDGTRMCTSLPTLSKPCCITAVPPVSMLCSPPYRSAAESCCTTLGLPFCSRTTPGSIRRHLPSSAVLAVIDPSDTPHSRSAFRVITPFTAAPSSISRCVAHCPRFMGRRCHASASIRLRPPGETECLCTKVQPVDKLRESRATGSAMSGQGARAEARTARRDTAWMDHPRYLFVWMDHSSDQGAGGPAIRGPATQAIRGPTHRPTGRTPSSSRASRSPTW